MQDPVAQLNAASASERGAQLDKGERKIQSMRCFWLKPMKAGQREGCSQKRWLDQLVGLSETSI